MNSFLRFSTLIVFLVLAYPPAIQAGKYIEIAPAYLTIDTPAASTQPLLLDFRLGYFESMKHLFELALMTGIKDGNQNQLKVEVPLAFSLFYHYTPYLGSGINVQMIAGVSRVDIKSSYPGISDTTDNFDGVSYGIGFTEDFESIPQLTMSVNWIRLYSGDDLNLTITNIGVKYEF
ncbi:MAG: hypothetical protein GY784_14300 [Gammaproteobacteria bacterium]|nr:hypothetical protein [Gammaproteobacteria bacterium]